MLLISILAISSCAVSPTMGSITAINMTSTPATNVRVGNTFIGYVGPGQTVTVYFTSAQSEAIISAGGFDKQSFTSDLKLV